MPDHMEFALKGFDIASGGGMAEPAGYIRSETEKWGAVARSANVVAE